jgi:hypothetical protein
VEDKFPQCTYLVEEGGDGERDSRRSDAAAAADGDATVRSSRRGCSGIRHSSGDDVDGYEGGGCGKEEKEQDIDVPNNGALADSNDGDGQQQQQPRPPGSIIVITIRNDPKGEQLPEHHLGDIIAAANVEGPDGTAARFGFDLVPTGRGLSTTVPLLQHPIPKLLGRMRGCRGGPVTLAQ